MEMITNVLLWKDHQERMLFTEKASKQRSASNNEHSQAKPKDSKHHGWTERNRISSCLGCTDLLKAGKKRNRIPMNFPRHWRVINELLFNRHTASARQ